MIAGLDGVVKKVNAGWKRILGYSPEELEGTSFLDLVHPDDRGPTLHQMSDLGCGMEVLGFENRYRHKSGEYRTLTWSARASAETRLIYAVAVDTTWNKRIAEDLDTAQKLLRTVLDSISVRVFWKDNNLVYRGCNAAFAKDAKLTNPEEIIGKTDDDMPWQAQKEAYRADDLSVIHSGEERLQFEESQSTPAGEQIELLTSKVPLRNDAGTIVGVLGTYLDITERKRAEDELKSSEARFRGFFELPTHGRCITSADKRWIAVNDKVCSILGYSQEELSSKTWEEMTHPEDIAADNAQFQRILAGEIEQYQLEKRFIRKDGAVIWTEISVGCVRKSNRSLDYVVCVLQDITARKETEAKLREALNLAEAGSRAKGEFLAMMSHELRTPLNGVLGFAELLADTPLDAEQKSYAEIIQTSGSHLFSIVNDILDLSSIEKGSMIIRNEPLGIADLVKSSEEAIERAALLKGITFRSVIDPAVPAQICGDDLRIRQILINLLGNAVKFTSTGSVSLHVATAAESGDPVLVFAVEDTGIGISPETMEVLFQPFTQAEMKLNRTHGGTGLGLAISQRLAVAMGGKITIDSTLGKGSTFSFRLPLAAVAQSSTGGGTLSECAGTEIPAPALPVSKLVLVAEDDPNNSLLAEATLRLLGYRVEFAADGAEAVATFVPGKFFAILMDMRMPVMDGLEAARIIRDLDPDVPIIALTANVMPGDRERCLAAGMNDYLAKPFKRADLAAKLDRICK